MSNKTPCWTWYCLTYLSQVWQLAGMFPLQVKISPNRLGIQEKSLSSIILQVRTVPLTSLIEEGEACKWWQISSQGWEGRRWCVRKLIFQLPGVPLLASLLLLCIKTNWCWVLMGEMRCEVRCQMEGATTLTRCSDLDFKLRIRSNLNKTHVSRVCVKSEEEMHARTTI